MHKKFYAITCGALCLFTIQPMLGSVSNIVSLLTSLVSSTQESLEKISDAYAYEPESMPSDPQTVTVMSYNIRTAWMDKDKGNRDWFERREKILQTITQYAPDIIGTQEENDIQHKWLEKELEKRGYVAIGKQASPSVSTKEALTEVLPIDADLVLAYAPQAIIEGGSKFSWLIPNLKKYIHWARYGNHGGHSTIYYKKDRIKLIEKKDRVWLSKESPKPSHSIWNKNLYNWLKSWGEKRIYTLGYFKDTQTGKSFTLINTHLSLSRKSQTKQARKIVEHIQKYQSDHPGHFLVMGDFNAGPEFVKEIFGPEEFVDTHAKAKKIVGPHGTYTNWGKENGLIDFILAKGAATIKQSAIVKRIENGQEAFPSDHRPKIISINLD